MDPTHIILVGFPVPVYEGFLLPFDVEEDDADGDDGEHHRLKDGKEDREADGEEEKGGVEGVPNQRIGAVGQQPPLIAPLPEDPPLQAEVGAQDGEGSADGQ